VAAGSDASRHYRFRPLSRFRRLARGLMLKVMSLDGLVGESALAEGTVKNHVSNLLLKLNARDRTRAALKALEGGHLG
jgi:DNA-binding NarL/FixJ family response regulator